MENPETSGSTLISCQEGRGGPGKCVLNYRRVPSSVGVPLLLGRTKPDPKRQLSWGRAADALVEMAAMTDGRRACMFCRYIPVFLHLCFFHFWALPVYFPTRVGPELVKDKKSLLLELLPKQSRVLQVGIKACFTLNWHVLSKPICKYFLLCADRPLTGPASILLENHSALIPQGQKGMCKPHLLHTRKKKPKKKKGKKFLDTEAIFQLWKHFCIEFTSGLYLSCH